MSFSKITEFENKVAKFFNSPYAVAIDCCTHGVELCLRYKNIRKITVPKRTYISIPFLASKLNIDLEWKDEVWTNYYYLTDNIIDAAVLWKKNGYIPNTFMNISFQFKKKREGDNPKIYCNCSKAFKMLNWKSIYKI